ncbi:MAG: hypothetical protein M1838_003666 [Thelocarpon superellum]|nr:MAG: hypothetical protein M1838_003666 [Thelocarpon superellum]
MDEVVAFERVFAFDPHWTYDNGTVEAISSHRRKLDNELFFDRLLRALSVQQAVQLYPPRSNQELRRLHQRIVSSAAPEHHRHSLLYYLLMDCRSHARAAEQFAARVFLPDKYKTYVDGLWHMDHLQFQDALEKLTQPSLIPTFPEEILYTLLRHAPPTDPTLPLSYYHTVSPALTTPKIRDAVFAALCTVSITESFSFARGWDDFAHRHLLEQLVAHVLSQSSGETRARDGVELVNVPMTEEEAGWFEEYLATGRGRTLHGAKDTLMMWRLATGRYAAVLEDGKGPSGRKVDGVNWTVLRDGLKNGMGSRTGTLSSVR